MPLTSEHLLKDLVAFDTVSRNSNLALLDYIETYLARFGVKGERFYDETGLKSNLWVTIGEGQGGIVLSGHVDVVPVEGQNWTHNPFDLLHKGDKLYGRGSCDMKGFVACFLSLVPFMVKQKLKAPIHFAISHDEETGCIGVRTMLRALALRDIKPRLCIVGEPTMMQVVIGHKGKRSLRCHIKGKEAHSSLAPTGVSAVHYGALLIAKIVEIGDRLALRQDLDQLYDVAVSTTNVGVFKGGEILNIVAGQAQFDFEFRCVEGDDVDSLVQEVVDYALVLQGKMQSVASEAGISFEDLSEIPLFSIAPESDAVTLVKRLVGRNSHQKVAYGTEAGLFQTMVGIPTVVIGPGSIEQAHKPDEFIEVSQLRACEAFLRKVVEELTV
jgi:acetylornithine deacetylase